MRRNHVCEHLPVGSTIESSDEKTLWTKAYDDAWFDDNSSHVHWSDREMDDLLGRGRAQQIIVDKELELEAIPAFDLEAGDYVVVTFGFWLEAGDDPLLFDPARSQTLLRVAGWTRSDGDDNWTIALDADEHTMDMIDWSQYQGENGYDRDLLSLYVGPATVFHYVSKGQDHLRWDDLWDWSHQHEFVDPPEVPVGWAEG